MVKQEMLGQDRWEFIKQRKSKLRKFLHKPTRDSLLELVENLWAALPRGDKEHLVDEMMLEKKTPEDVAEILQELFDGERGIDEIDIKGFGIATSSELLHTRYSGKRAILNSRSRHAMSSLGYYVSRNNVTHDEYTQFCENVRVAAEKFNLETEVRRFVESSELGGIPEEITQLELADYAFHLYAEGYIDLEKMKTQKEGKRRIEIPAEVLEKIDIVVEEDPTYMGRDDFVLSAIRNELRNAT
jgi:hypothetical protein